MGTDFDIQPPNEDFHSEMDESLPIEPDVEDNPVVTVKDCIKQIVISCVAFSIVIQVGANMSFSAILVPQLSEDDDLHINKSEASWIASLIAIALPLGSLTVGILMDTIGRKLLTILITIPYIISWILQIFATELWHIYLARIIAGYTGGLTTVAIVYVSEVSHPSFRQALLSLNSVFVSLGVLVCYFFGTMIKWKLTAVVMCFIAIVTIITMFFMPESPYWYLIFKNDYNRALRSFRWIYKSNSICHSQYQHLLSIKAKKMNVTTAKTTISEYIRSIIQIYTEKSVYKPTFILMLLFIAQQITGGYVIIFYATDIFRKLNRQHSNKEMSDFASLVMLGIIRFLTSVVSALISKNFGRRTIMILSGVGMAIFSFFAAAYISFTLFQDEKTSDALIKNYETINIAFIFMLGYVAFGSLGFLVIPWALIGELLPVKVRGVVGGCLISFAYLVMFLFLKLFPSILDSFEMQSILYALSVLNLFSVMFVYYYLPETLGRNFSEIEEYFEK
ncbi:hypothetical protein WA026_005148 [Henosepilachna vigintioctopunctata]|uniref:Major facilitator superfamily (MFS) profile domain-containing protein n=1 Tax=Henosepilachna vigintioctopunctata TaxID=420089 RepID=A0AAW1UM91_9CUCU